MAFLTREQLLAVPDLEIEAIPGPQGHGEVGIRLLTGAERDWLIEQSTGAREQGKRLRAFPAIVCALGLCDEQGGRLFTTEEAEALTEKSGLFLENAAAAILRKNKLNDADPQETEKKEPLVLNDASGSSSPGPLAAP